ncbi:hypothetical protein TELCIR_12804 [Teladorsagia circumcincta]|uniref:Uncharacterized protein n=1 Tax=Teladorsagia circumcincta TaxID=45464 RepID=A0A2G9U5I4_TELCI|nr:hypothetical protein TELCIR_12804 [Teladorsagia circumcincta]
METYYFDEMDPAEELDVDTVSKMDVNIPRFLIILLALAGMTSSLNCYSGVSTCGSNPPTAKERCKSRFCVRITSAQVSDYAHVYGCDTIHCQINFLKEPIHNAPTKRRLTKTKTYTYTFQ